MAQQQQTQLNQGIITNCSGVGMDQVKMSEPRTNAMGGQSVYLNKATNGGKFVFQLKDVTLPFGISSFQGDQVDTPAKLSVDISFRNLDDNNKLSEFHRFVTEVDQKVMQSACDGLLGTTKSMEVVKELFRSTIRTDPNGKYSDTMKFNIMSSNQGNPTKLYNDKKEEIPLTAESIPKGAKIDLIVEMGAVYIIGKKNLGITWRAPQIRIKEMGDKLADYAFVDSDDEEECPARETKVAVSAAHDPMISDILEDVVTNVVV